MHETELFACRQAILTPPGVFCNCGMHAVTDAGVPESLGVPDAELALWHCPDLGVAPEELLQELSTQTPWRQESVRIAGRVHPQPRLTAWYGEPGSAYTYSGLTLQPLPWTARLAQLRRIIESLCSHRFNSVLLNHYRDEHDSMGLHSDDEPELGPAPVIASLSLGAERVFMMKHRRRKDVPPLRMRLPTGSLLVMRGATQANWRHGVPKEKNPCGPRINLTFRRVGQPGQNAGGMAGGLGFEPR